VKHPQIAPIHADLPNPHLRKSVKSADRPLSLPEFYRAIANAALRLSDAMPARHVPWSVAFTMQRLLDLLRNAPLDPVARAALDWPRCKLRDYGGNASSLVIPPDRFDRSVAPWQR